jgi:LacI family transcriptional regulator
MAGTSDRAAKPKVAGTASRPRLRDVADLAGVDISVASRALRRAPELNVKPETRRRIEEAAISLGYVANSAAASLKTARTSTIGLVLPNLVNPGGAIIAEGATEQATAAGYLVLVTTGSSRACLPILEPRVDGLLVASATSDSNTLPDPGAVHVPLLLVNRREPGSFPGIVADDEAGGKLATDYLISLGHTDIGHVAGPQQTDTSRRRRNGFEKALRGHGLEVRAHWIAEGPYDEAGGYHAASLILEQNPRPTALLVSNLLATIGAMAAARNLGVRLPHDLSLITFDDASLAKYMDPPVTTVRLPLLDLGRRAVTTVINMIDGDNASDVLLDVDPEIVLRQSCMPPATR